MSKNGAEFFSTGTDYRKVTTALLAFIALTGVVFVLYELMDVLLPLVFALILSQLFKPLISILRARRIPLALCVVAVLLIVAAMLTAILLIITGGVQSIVAQAPKYQDNLTKLVQSFDAWSSSFLALMGKHVAHVELADSVQLSSITSILASGAGSFFNLLANMFLTLLFLIFLLLGSEDFPAKIYKAFSTEDSYRLTEIMTMINAKVRRYLVTKTIINVIVAGATVIILLAFGVDFPYFIGILTFFLNYIPNFGPLMAVALPVLTSLLGLQSWGFILALAIVLVVFHSVIGNFVEPKWMGSSLDLSPLAVLLSLIFWGWVWGVWGMILAVPITSIIKIGCEHIVPLKPVALLMGTMSAHASPQDPGLRDA
ncbi:MAG TPA: AI-2E family transporter [Bacteroidota bacterium]|nr:AI-2E family transporter [Bacteroidota bacterium]